MKYQEVVARIEEIPMMPTRAPNLEPMLQALNDLALSFEAEKIILIAGTNGKGSTAKTLATFLEKQNLSVGFYCSPHLLSIRERIQVNGQWITQEDFVTAYQELKNKTAVHLSHFEILTAMMAIHFSKSQLDYWVLEVGMGGLWDATNAIPHKTSAIAKLGFDHQEFLGNSIQEIAANKFGIIHGNNHVVVGPMPKEVESLLFEKTVHSKLFRADTPEYKVYKNALKPRYTLKGYDMALPGYRAAENSMLALKIFESLGFKSEQALPYLKDVDWPARMSHLKENIFISADHNPQGLQSLKELLEDYEYSQIHILFACSQGRNPKEMLSILNTIPRSKLYLSESNFRSLKVAEWPADLKANFEWSEKDAHKALQRIESQPQDMVLITGSIYFASLFLQV